jgi:hypothetical protein
MKSISGRRLIALSFWLWIGGMLALYLGSFGPVIRILMAALFA